MKRIRASLSKLTELILSTDHLLEVAQSRYLANRKRAFQANNQKKTAQKKAQNRRNKGHIKMAEQFDAAAGRHAHVATKNHERAQYWLGRVKVLIQKKHGLTLGLEKAQAELHAWMKSHGVQIHSNKATGGTARQRLRAIMHASWHACADQFTDASGKVINRFNFYDQAGAFDVDHCVTGPPSDHRDDCSSWGTSVHNSAGLPDPNGEDLMAGFTGTILAHCEKISRSEVETGDFIVYLSYWGDTTGHHTELVDDPTKETTIGHGSALVDPGIFNLFGNGLYEFRRNPVLRPR